MMNREKHFYSRTEKALIVLGAILFALMMYFYVADISLRSWLWGAGDDYVLSTPIGKVTQVSGSARRQRARDLGFRSAGAGTVLYPNDTLATGSDSSMIIELSDGQRFEVGPDSLVKLAFGADYSMGGMAGLVRIEVFSKKGEPQRVVQAPRLFRPQASPAPVPSPRVIEVPLSIVNLSPPADSLIEFSKDEVDAGKKEQLFAFAANRKVHEELKIDVRRRLERGQLQTVASLPAGAVAGDETNQYSALAALTQPGDYEWEVRDAAGRAFARSRFRVPDRLRLIEIKPTESESNRLEGMATKKAFDGFQLSWSPVSGPGNYTVRVFKADGDKVKAERPILVKRMAVSRLILNRDNLLHGRLAYSVEKPLGHGFMAASDLHFFGLDFVAPEPTAPAAGAVFEGSAGKLVFFTWAKTNYTDAYEFEVASDPGFRSVVSRYRGKDNFYSMALPARPGQYSWRVRSLAKELSSPFSRPRPFSVK